MSGRLKGKLQGKTNTLTKPGDNFLWFQRAKTTEFLKLFLKALLVNVHEFYASHLRILHMPTLLVVAQFCGRQSVLLTILRGMTKHEKQDKADEISGHCRIHKINVPLHMSPSSPGLCHSGFSQHDEFGR